MKLLTDNGRRYWVGQTFWRKCMISVDKYHISARVFHWLGALLIVMAWFLVEQGEAFISLHKAVGFSFLVWTILRVVNRLIVRSPKPLPMPAWQTKVSYLTHVLLYLVMIAMPLSGFLASMFGGYGVDVFGWIQIDGFQNVDRQLSRTFLELHEDVFWVALQVLVFLHIAAALYHQFVMKDNILSRIR